MQVALLYHMCGIRKKLFVSIFWSFTPKYRVCVTGSKELTPHNSDHIKNHDRFWIGMVTRILCLIVVGRN